MSKAFYLSPDDSTATSPRTSLSSASSNESDLPFPLPLPRSAFLSPDFSPQIYLSTLHNRHQTLEDLRTELRSRSQLLSRELLDLVNANYQDFLNLGNALKGGEEKVEEVRVGLMGWMREVGGLQGVVEGRREEVKMLVEEREGVRGQVEVGRMLLDVDRRLTELEGALMVEGGEAADGFGDETEESEDEEEEGAAVIPLTRLRRQVQRYLVITKIVEQVGKEHPFLVAQQPRLTRLKNTILLDMGTALRQAAGTKTSNKSRLVPLLTMYSDLGEAGESIKILKDLKKGSR